VIRLFVTGSGTGVGKTLVTAALAHQLAGAGKSVRAVKPVISGYTPETRGDSDTAQILDSLGLDHGGASIERVSPFRFAAPLSPDMAAAREGRRLDFAALLRFCRECASGPEDVLLLEGVGGVMAPLTDRETVLDWIAAMGSPCLLVVGSYLGTISHTLTAAEALRQRRVPITGLVISESMESPVPPAETKATLRRFLPDVRITLVPRIAGETPWRDAPDLTSLVGG